MYGESTVTFDQDLVKDFNRCRIAPLLLGVFPLTHTKHKLVVTFSGFFFSFLMVTSLVAFVLFQAFLIREEKLKASDITKNMIFALVNGMLWFSVILSLIKVIRRKELLLDIIQELSELKIFLEVSGISWRPKRKIFLSVILSIAFIVAKIIDIVLYRKTVCQVVNAFLLCYLFVVVMWVFGNFMWFTSSLAEGFRGLAFCIKPTCTGDQLQRLMKHHYLLTATSNRLNHVYSYGFTLGFIASFVFSLFQAYVFINYISRKLPIFRIAICLITTLVPLILCFTIVGSCERVKHQIIRLQNMGSKSGSAFESDLLEDFNKSHRISLIVGVFPLRLVDSGLVFTWPGLTCSMLMLTLLSACILVQLLTSQSDDYLKVSSAQQIAFYFDYGALNVAIVIYLWSTFQQRKRFLFVIRVLSKVKRSLDIAGISWRPKRTFFASVIHSLLFLSLNFIDPLTSDTTAFGLANTFGYYFLIEIVTWIFTDFMWFADNLAEGFRGLAFSLQQARTAGDIEYLMKCHYLLTEASSQLDEAYSMGLSFPYFTSFFLVFFNVYDGYVSITISSPHTEKLAYFSWATLIVVLYIRIINSVSRVYYQAKRFDVILYRLLVYKCPTNITQNNTTLKLFFHFSGKTNVVFTLSGFFKLDWSLLYSMMAAGCTYLIVIVQMNDMN